MARVLDRPSGRTSCAIRPRGARQTGSAHDARRAGGCAGAGSLAPPRRKFRARSSPHPCHRQESEAATVASDEICRGDEDRLEQLSDSPTSDGVIRFLIELRCEKLRPQLLRLAESGWTTRPRGRRRRCSRRVFCKRPRQNRSLRRSTLCRRRECERTNRRVSLAQASLRAAFSRNARANAIDSAELAADPFGPIRRASEELGWVPTNASRRRLKRQRCGALS